MTKAQNLIDENKFWSLIANSKVGAQTLEEQRSLLEKEFAALSEQEFFGLDYFLRFYSNQTYTGNLWCVAFIVMGGCSDDGFDYFRYWLVSRGKEVCLKAIKDPDSLCDEFDKIPEGEIPEFEDFPYILADAFEKKFNKAYDAEMMNYDFGKILSPNVVFNWRQDDEESIKKNCPLTFQKWWKNNRF